MGNMHDYCHSRGRDAGYPTPPAQIPACGIPAPGSSVVLASAIPVMERCWSPQGGWLVLLQPDSVRYEFPLKAAYHCQPLPLVIGATVSEYYGLIRLPHDHRVPTLFRLSSPSCLQHVGLRIDSFPGFPYVPK